jgi:polyhydroxyalkanoate synthesis regulator phasin
MLMGVLRKFFQEVVVPELEQIRGENAEIRATLQVTNKRLDDITIHLSDQSRRIDAGREELTHRIDAVREDLAHKIDETNTRLDRLYEVIVRREEHEQLASRVARLEQQVSDLMARFAA